jgi:FkbM family methyltransferase
MSLVAALKYKLKRALGIISASQHRLHQAYSQWEAVKGDETLRQQYPLGQDSIVFDVGGYKGQWASDMFARYLCRIYVFEPVASFSRQLAKRFAHNPGIRCFAFGLAAETRQQEICLLDDGSSIINGQGEKERIELVSINEFLQDQGIEEIDLLKINIEGAEYELLEAMIRTGSLAKVKYLQIQFHITGPDSADRLARMREALAATHRQDWCFDFIWEGWSRKNEARETPRA